MNHRPWTAWTLVLALLSGCSNGGSGKSVSDFACQEDALAWHKAHPEDGLDGDDDGIVGEALPKCSSLPDHDHVIYEPPRRVSHRPRMR